MFDPFSPESRPVAAPDEQQQAFNAYRPGFSDFLGAMAGEGFWATTTGQGAALLQVERADDGKGPPLAAEEWQQSPWYRPGLAWDEGMTVSRARALADVHDENSYRRWIIQGRQAGIAEQVAGFGAAIAGSIPAAENFIPVVGPVWRAAQVARLAKTGVTVMGAATARMGQIGGRAAVFAADAAASTALAQPVLMASRQSFGDDVTWADAMLDIALGAFAGAAIGGAAGVVARSRGLPAGTVSDARSQQAAADTLGKAALDTAEGRPVNLAEMAGARSEIETAAATAGRRVGDADRLPFRELTADPQQRGAALADFYRMANSEQGVDLPKQRLQLGAVAAEVAERIKAETGIDVTGFRRSIDVAEARHINRKHGPAAPAVAAGGDLPVGPEDMARYFDVVEKPDAVYASRNRRGLAVLIHEKKIGDWHYVVEEVRAGRKTLAVESFYKARKQTTPDERSGGQSGGADTQVESGLARPKRTPAQPAAAEYRAETAELEPAFADPDLTTAADLPAEAPRPLPKNRAEELGLDEATGDFEELADLKRLDEAGRLTAEEKAALEAAEADLKKTAKLEDAFAAAKLCALGA